MYEYHIQGQCFFGGCWRFQHKQNPKYVSAQVWYLRWCQLAGSTKIQHFHPTYGQVITPFLDVWWALEGRNYFTEIRLKGPNRCVAKAAGSINRSKLRGKGLSRRRLLLCSIPLFPHHAWRISRAKVDVFTFPPPPPERPSICQPGDVAAVDALTPSSQAQRGGQMQMCWNDLVFVVREMRAAADEATLKASRAPRQHARPPACPAHRRPSVLLLFWQVLFTEKDSCCNVSFVALPGIAALNMNSTVSLHVFITAQQRIWCCTESGS